MKRLTALYPPPCVTLELPVAPKPLDEQGREIDLERECVLAAIDQMFQTKTKKKNR
jgi:hypothetical protein